MSETALLAKYTQDERNELERWLLATPMPQKAAEPPTQPAAPVQPVKIEKGGGFFNAIGRAWTAGATQFVQGGRDVADALVPPTGRITGEAAKVAADTGEITARYSQGFRPLARRRPR